MKDIERLKLIIQVAQMYYEYGHTQRVIADKLGISRPTISRLLAEGREMGIVQITIRNPLGYCSRLEEIFRKEFDLKEVIIAPQISDNLTQILVEMGDNYLNRILKDGDTIGLSWGNTLQQLAHNLRPKKMNHIRVVQMKGGMGVSGANVHASQIVEMFSSAYWGRANYLPVPAIVDTQNVKKAFMSDSSLKRTMKVAEEINVAIFSIGALHPSAAQVQAGYITVQDIQSLQSKGAVGDICSRFYNLDGQITDPILDQRTIGIELAELCEKEYAIAIAGGKEKAPGILGALKGGFMNVLITDEETAVQVLEMAGIKS
ncbi:MAG: sugar-binding transcriptional regulator [Halanaerobiales bacterium]|nr:sugar-binding transcriptional regulator [Halanaerobiales bacterium]